MTGFRNYRRILQVTAALSLVFTATLPLLPQKVSAADAVDQGFSVQVSPSPLVATIIPGKTTSLDLQIRNTDSQTQQLKMGLRSFSIGNTDGQVNLSNDPPADVAKFVSFSSPTFSVDGGQIFTQHVTIKTPASAGFTYSFAITISQQNPAKPTGGKTAITGSVADFTLLSVDKPGAVRKLELSKLSVTKHVYEFLPATISLTFKNTGNTLVQPGGSIFVQRGANDKTPLAALDINKNQGYILPGTSRTLTATWNDGFPHYDTTTAPGKSGPQYKLTWSGGLGKLRIGRYTAKVVAVYDDGQRDVPIAAQITFWVIPWRILLGIFVVLAFIAIGVISTVRKSAKKLRRKAYKKDAKTKV